MSLVIGGIPLTTGTSHLQTYMFTSRIVSLLHKDHYSLIPDNLICMGGNWKLAKPGTKQFELIDEFVKTVKEYREIPN